MRFLLLLLITISFVSCEKIIENAQQQAAMDIIIKGRWKVHYFAIEQNEMTGMFTEYEFQFKDNYTVDAIKNGIVEKTGVWSANTDTRTMTTTFTNAYDPISYLNGPWYLSDPGNTHVKAEQVVNGQTHYLEIMKQ